MTSNVQCLDYVDYLYVSIPWGGATTGGGATTTVPSIKYLVAYTVYYAD